MDYRKFKQAKAIEAKNKKKLLELNPNLNDDGGIYFFTRKDEHGFLHAYIGQSNTNHGILTRLAEHLVGHKQHIDLSIRKHGLYDPKNNPFGWKVHALNFPDSVLDEKEIEYIKLYASKGYQLKNVSLGGQGTGRAMINQTKSPKNYRDGIQQGRINMAREIKHIVDKHLVIGLKKETKVSQKALDKFWMLLGEEKEGDDDG